MKKLLALSAVAAFSGSAMAADLPARYTKAPAPLAPLYSWTGFYVFGGAGGGLWAADSNLETFPGAVAIGRDQRLGGSGWFGTVGIGYDWQFLGWPAFSVMVSSEISVVPWSTPRVVKVVKSFGRAMPLA
jgi:outer membrane immunogenic protein